MVTDVLRLCSIGLALIDTLDDLVHAGRIEPQLAMKVIATFDRAITEVLADKVKARLSFKVMPLKARLRSAPWLIRAASQGSSRYLSFLRRGLDVSDQRRQLQAR